MFAIPESQVEIHSEDGRPTGIRFLIPPVGPLGEQLQRTRSYADPSTSVDERRRLRSLPGTRGFELLVNGAERPLYVRPPVTGRFAEDLTEVVFTAVPAG